MPVVSMDNALGRDVLSRYICSTLEEAVMNPEGIDVVVIGSGMYGGYCASKIYELSKIRFGGASDKALRVLVLEAGPFLVPEHSQNIPNLGLPQVSIFEPLDLSSGQTPDTKAEVWGAGWRSNQKFPGQAYCIGGKSIFWGGWCPQLTKADLAQWPSKVRDYLTKADTTNPVATRPLDHFDRRDETKVLKRNEPLSGYEAAEYEIGVIPGDDFVFDPVDLSSGSLAPKTKIVGLNRAFLHLLNKEKVVDPRLTDIYSAPIGVQTQSFISGLFALDKYSSVPAMTAAARADHSGPDAPVRFAVVPRCHVTRLLCAANEEATEVGTRRVDRIDVVYDGNKQTIKLGNHCQVVMALGCIETTRLALESFSLADSKLKLPQEELIGRNYMVHLRADIAFKVKRAKLAEFVETSWPGTKLADELQLASLHLQGEGVHGRYHYQFYAATNKFGPDSNMYRMIPDSDIQRQISTDFDTDTISLVLRICGEAKNDQSKPLRTPGFDYIDLAGGNDFDNVFGHRRAWVQFNGSGGGNHADDPIWEEMHDTVHKIRGILQLGEPDDFVPITTNLTPGTQTTDFSRTALALQQGPGTTFHDSGTLWMGDDPDKDVCDSNGHLHHMTNVYATDQSIFPTVGSANPVLTGIALSRMVAENIVARHSTSTLTDGQLVGFQPVSLKSADRGWKKAAGDGMQEFNDTIETKARSGIGLYYLPVVVSDFELYVEWKTYRFPEFPNSGLILWTPDPAGVDFSDQAQFAAFYDASTEIQIDDLGKNFKRDDPGRPLAIFGDSRYKTGAIYGVAPAKEWAGKVPAPDFDETTRERYWNYYLIKAEGGRVAVNLNGRLVSEAVLPPSKRQSGYIGFQWHTGRVGFRNLRVKLPGGTKL